MGIGNIVTSSTALLLTGMLLRVKFHFFFPDQLKAYVGHPELMTLAYSLFALGNVLLFPGVILLAKRICVDRPLWGIWGGMFVVLGLFARTFHAGADYLAFQVAHQKGVEEAMDFVANSYGTFHIFHSFSLFIMIGWPILAIGAYLSKELRWYQCIGLFVMISLPLGVLKGTTTAGLVAIVGLCIAFIPLGIKVLREGEKASLKKLILWTSVVVFLCIFSFIFGELG
ncbi:hypothetical protein [Listeria rustica]|uniref:Uncharacterized protein n=1 Tax=Listeria rustica TaxID=2713503 RepID=A0A7W1T841_9LIST|nr:hypothetical protein [Listeria rustica]MBA3927149.1 hypothetical protein [Listeria rustica]